MNPEKHQHSREKQRKIYLKRRRKLAIQSVGDKPAACDIIKIQRKRLSRNVAFRVIKDYERDRKDKTKKYSINLAIEEGTDNLSISNFNVDFEEPSNYSVVNREPRLQWVET